MHGQRSTAVRQHCWANLQSDVVKNGVSSPHFDLQDSTGYSAVLAVLLPPVLTLSWPSLLRLALPTSDVGDEAWCDRFQPRALAGTAAGVGLTGAGGLPLTKLGQWPLRAGARQRRTEPTNDPELKPCQTDSQNIGTAPVRPARQ